MKTRTCISILIIPVFLILASCAKEPALDNTSELFKDYKALEKMLDTTPTHPNAAYDEQLSQFLTKYGWNNDLADIPDGTYEAFSVPDRYQMVHYIRFNVKDHRFVSVYYNEFSELDLSTLQFSDGGQEGKRGAENYPMRDFIVVAYPKMEEELLATQNPQDVDGVSGASLALNRFRIMVMKALYEYRTNTIINKKNYTLGENFDTSIFE